MAGEDCPEEKKIKTKQNKKHLLAFKHFETGKMNKRINGSARWWVRCAGGSVFHFQSVLFQRGFSPLRRFSNSFSIHRTKHLKHVPSLLPLPRNHPRHVRLSQKASKTCYFAFYDQVYIPQAQREREREMERWRSELPVWMCVSSKQHQAAAVCPSRLY